MKRSDLLPAWSRILRGYRPLLSIEITKECPLRCPGCYAYNGEHLGQFVTLRDLNDRKGEELVTGVLRLVRRYRPIHVSIVGGEPLVRWRELDRLLPQLDAMRIETQVVTSAVRPIPEHWAAIRSLHLAVSVDGLPPEHDRRRAPATYDRILKHIAGQSVIIHCTITRQMLRRDDYLHEFAEFWSSRPEARKIWFSLYTPQEGEQSEERLQADDRRRALERLAQVAADFPKVYLPRALLDGYRLPAGSPQDCIFAQSTTCISADLETRITPCQFGGKPVCRECGCIASSGLASIGRYALAGVVPVSALFSVSRKIGDAWGGMTQLKQRP
ncbi:MAG TPA: radical SAM protein [Bryobacteraceae bacterium]|nr:radical SAM protein [Bryobacteraceae bacterium]